MKNFKTILASITLVFFALLAGASIDNNGDLEGWFIALIVIVPLVITVGIVTYFDSRSSEKSSAQSKVPANYKKNAESTDSELYVDEINHKILVLAYGASSHDIIEIDNFDKTSVYAYNNHFFAVDDLNKQVLYVHADNLIEMFSKKIAYIDILGIDISENGNSIFQKSTKSAVGRALVGGALLGGVGAIIGGVTGKTKEKKIIDSYKITIQVNDTTNPTLEIELMEIPTELDDFGTSLLQEARTFANQVKSALLAIIKANDIELNLAQAQAAALLNAKAQQQMLESRENQILVQGTTYSVADELKKLADLHKAGILTDEEFEEQKKKLLNQ